MTANDAYAGLLARSKEAATLGSCAAILGWDERVNMPRQAASFRGDQMAFLARLGHELATAPDIGEALAVIESSDLVRDSNSDAAVNAREIRRGYDRAVKVPKTLVEELARVTIQAQQHWQEARQENNFAAFRPWLEKVVKLKREEADAVGYRDHAYDALLDEYEPDCTAAEIKSVFQKLAAELVPLIAAIRQSPRQAPTEILRRDFPVELQKPFAAAAAAAIGFDLTAGRMDTTTHPFCSGIGPGDCRITTRYNPRFFNEAFFGVLHEAGHGIYEQGLDPEHFGTPCGSYCSLGIHESQSRLWENQVGRSRPFWDHFFRRAKQQFPDALNGVLIDDFYFAINEVKPSFIRVEADEATYNLHIILRFELELSLMTGDLLVADLPGAWNEKFTKLFNLTPSEDREGCLQDIHWSGGGIGYFPTYTLGNLYAAQFMSQAKRDLTNLEDDFRMGEFGRLKHWLNEKIHSQGRRWRATELCRRVTGSRLDYKPLMAYLHEKYGALYQLGAG